MKKLLLLFSLLFVTGCTQNFGAEPRTFTSGQVGVSPTNGDVLQTDGVSSTWVAVASLGISGGGASFFDGFMTSSLYITDGSTTSTLRSNALYLATSTANALGLFNVDSSGNTSASGTLQTFGLLTARSGFISNASSSIGAGLQVSGPLNASSSLFVSNTLMVGQSPGKAQGTFIVDGNTGNTSVSGTFQTYGATNDLRGQLTRLARDGSASAGWQTILSGWAFGAFRELLAINNTTGKIGYIAQGGTQGHELITSGRSVLINGRSTAGTAVFNLVGADNANTNASLDIVGTWNNSAARIWGIRMDVTDTASAASSTLLDLQVSDVTKFTVQKDGYVGINTSTLNYLPAALTFNASTTASGGLNFGSDTKLYRSAASELKLEGGLITTASSSFSGGLQVAGALNASSSLFVSTSLFLAQSPGKGAGVFSVDGLTGDISASGTAKLYGYDRYVLISYSTSTAWAGTTTIYLAPADKPETWIRIKCETDTGTVKVSIYDGTNRMDLLTASTTIGTFNLATNNTFTSNETRRVDIGTPASSPKSISCKATYRETY